MCEDHRKFCEDMHFHFASSSWVVVGLLSQKSGSINASLLPNTEWYLAIGSMINPVSLSLRNLKPIRSYPAYAPGWKLIFKGFAGMASIEQDGVSCMHGVAHLMTKEDMKVSKWVFIFIKSGPR